jgi:hypothetical protein
VRDNALFIAGASQPRDIGGPSVKPYQPAGYYEPSSSPTATTSPTPTREQWRRGLYMHWQRTFLHPMLANFDAPAATNAPRAQVNSNTPQQALTLLNDPAFVEAARLFAARLLGEKDDGRSTKLKSAFRLA